MHTSRPHLDDMKSGHSHVQLVLRLPDTLEQWPTRMKPSKTERLRHRLSLQDNEHFPSLQGDSLDLEAGFFHKILVRFLSPILHNCQEKCY